MLTEIFTYFAQFPPLPVLQRLFVQPDASRETGYAEIMTEALARPGANILPEIDAFVVSGNENFVSERIKNAKGYLLFVEYGSLSADLHAGTSSQNLAVSVVRNFSDSNSDNLNEILHMNACLDLLRRILARMDEDQDALDACGLLIKSPVEIYPVDPAAFYGCGGWLARFANETF